MSHAEWIEELMAHGGFAHEHEADHVARSVLGTLGERLGRPEAEALAAELPEAWARALTESRFDRAFGAGELYARVAARENVSLGFAVEHTALVARVLAAALSDAALVRLWRALSPDLVALFRRPEPTAPPAPRAGRGRTLADGRPGSRHPLSEAALPGAHADSVARANPHGDTKLSSARGLTQEREGDSLAEGHVHTRPLSESKS